MRRHFVFDNSVMNSNDKRDKVGKKNWFVGVKVSI
jgi:hypothetical protein